MLYKLLQGKSFNADTTRAFFTRNEIDLGMKKRFDLPLYSSELKTGIYKTFNEFKNNNPSITNIKTVYKKGKLESVPGNNGEKIDLKNFWGVCDGSKRYMVFAKSLQNSFLVIKASKFYPIVQKQISEVKPILQTMQQNMEYFRLPFLKWAMT